MAEAAKSDFEFPSDAEYSAAVFEEGGELTINLADIKEMKFENIPKGIYLAEVDECQYGMSQSSGSPMFSLKFKITEGEYAGRKLPAWLSFSQKALPGTKANLARIAPELVTKAFNPQEIANTGYLNGKKVRIRVDLGEYNGEKRSQIRGYMSAGTEGSADGFFQA